MNFKGKDLLFLGAIGLAGYFLLKRTQPTQTETPAMPTIPSINPMDLFSFLNPVSAGTTVSKNLADTITSAIMPKTNNIIPNFASSAISAGQAIGKIWLPTPEAQIVRPAEIKPSTREIQTNYITPLPTLPSVTPNSIWGQAVSAVASKTTVSPSVAPVKTVVVNPPKPTNMVNPVFNMATRSWQSGY